MREAHEIDFTKFDKIPMEFIVHKRTEIMDYDTVLAMVDAIPAPVKLRIFNNDIRQEVIDRTFRKRFSFNQWIKGTNTSRHFANQLK